MKIKHGSIVVETSGKLGGQDVLKSRSGHSLRNRSFQLDKQSASRSSVQSAFALLSKYWRELSQAQRKSWNSFASDVTFPDRFYDTTHYTGQQIFVKLNFNILLMGNSILLDPPSVIRTESYSIDLVINSGSGGTLFLNISSALAAGDRLKVFATRPLSRGVTAKPKLFRFIKLIDSAPSGQFDVYDEYVNIFGSVGDDNSQIIFKIIPVSYSTGFEGVQAFSPPESPVVFVADQKAKRVLGYPRLFSHSSQIASNVLGQSDFKTASDPPACNVSPTGLWLPHSARILDCRLVIVDRNHSRVLIFNTMPKSLADRPDIILGQPDLVTCTRHQPPPGNSYHLNYPFDCAWDGTHFMVLDTESSRVLCWIGWPTVNMQPADIIIGHLNDDQYLPNDGGAPSARTLNYPKSIDCIAGVTYVSDSGNNRVLVFNPVTNVDFQAADLVIGQADFVSVLANRGGSPADNTLNAPSGCAVMGNLLIIADQNNHRALLYTAIPLVNGAPAQFVYGQPGFDTNARNQGGDPAAYTLDYPMRPAVFAGILFICDRNNHRVLRYNGIPAQTNVPAVGVLGQTSLNCNGFYSRGPVSSKGFKSPVSIAFLVE